MEVQVKSSICNIIASGSTGNCEIYNKSFVIDIGVPYSYIEPYKKDLKIIFLSHAHFDHFNIKTLKRLQFERPTLRIACGEWMVEYLNGLRNIDVLNLNVWYDYGEFKVSIGKLYHDLKNCFFRLDFNGYKVFRATDTSTLSGISARNYNEYFIESNFDADTVWDKIRELEKIGRAHV